MKKNRILAALLAITLCAGASGAQPAVAAEQSYTVPLEGSPSGIAVCEDGSLLVTDTWENVIWRIHEDSVELWAGTPGEHDLLGRATGGYTDGAAQSAAFSSPYDIVPYRDGYAVSDTDNQAIRLISEGMVSTLANADAGLSRPAGLASDADGNLYIADSGNNTIFRLDAQGALMPYIGGTEGTQTGTLNETGLSEPAGLCWYEGKLYIADAGNHRILCAEGGTVSVLAGGVKDSDDENELYGGSYRNGSVRDAGFSSPQDVLATEHGVFVSDAGNGALRLIADGTVRTFRPRDDEAYGALYPASPLGLAVPGDTMYVCDSFARLLIKADIRPLLPSYADLPADMPGYGAALTLYQYDILEGASESFYDPYGNVTRGFFISVLGKLHSALYPDVIIAGEGLFADVPEDAYYANAVQWAADNKITNGVGANLYAPDTAVTREMAAMFLYNYARFKSDTVLPDGTALERFADRGDVSAWAAEAMAWAVSGGLLPLDEQGKLAPADTLNRLQMAQIFSDLMFLP